MGTPKTLGEAIENGLCTGDLKNIKSNLHLHIKDFLANSFGPLFLTTEGKELTNIKELYEKITRSAK